MRRELAIEVVQLLPGRRVHHAGQAQVLAFARGPHLHGRAIEVRHMTNDDSEYGLREALLGAPEDLDGEGTWELEKGLSHGLPSEVRVHAATHGGGAQAGQACALPARLAAVDV